MTWIYLLAAVAIGVLFSLQPAINAVVAKTIGSPMSAAGISISISLITIIALLPLFGSGNLRPVTLLSLPWWCVIGGLIGVAVVAGGLVIVPITGVAMFFVCVVAGQLVGASVLDQIGGFGLEVRPMSLLRALGLALVFVGVLLVRRG